MNCNKPIFTNKINYMNYILNKFIAILFIAFATIGSTAAQEISLEKDLHFEVNRISPGISITKAQMNDANTLLDLNRHYKPSWVKEYLSVEISANHGGKLKKAFNKSDYLTEEQKQLMKGADSGSNIKVMIRYMPKNSLPHNDIAEEDFTFTIDPKNDANYKGGQSNLLQYVKTNAIDKIPNGTFTGYALAGIKFTVELNGEIVNAHIWESSKNEEIDTLLLQSICNMPNWKPAEYEDGTKAAQEFVLTVGNMENCMVHLLNIKKLSLE